MSKSSHPHRGSLGYSPRKRARSERPRVRSWAKDEDKPKIQGFGGYKAGMTHVIMPQYRKTATTAEQDIMVPVTVVETPPIFVVGIRFYRMGDYGLRAIGDVWTEKVNSNLKKRLPLPDEFKTEEMWKSIKTDDADEIRIVAHMKPYEITGVPKKTPEIMELRIGGGTIQERIEYAKSILGKEITIDEYLDEGQWIDVVSITKGKGFQGPVKRWGVKLLTHKNSKHRRLTGTLGPWRPHYVMWQVPQSGQMGYHQRTEYNKLIIKVGKNIQKTGNDDITPDGGFVNYGKIRSNYILIKGSIPGPAKRFVKIRDAVRSKEEKVQLNTADIYISRESKQGV